MNTLVYLGISVGIFVPVIVVALALGVAGGYLVLRYILMKSGKDAKKIIEEAKKTAETHRREAVMELKQELRNMRQESDKENQAKKIAAEREIDEKKKAANELEQKLLQREERLDNRSNNLDKREEILNVKEQKIDQVKADLDGQFAKANELIEEQNKKLIEISGLKVEDAKKIILERIENEMADEVAVVVKEAEDRAKVESNKKSQMILANAIQQYAGDAVSEKTVSVVPLPNDDMKGRIIGREGRNIRAIEASTGVDLIIDDTPEAVVISCFDPIRREIAKRTLEALISDGRIQPSRIEELVAKFKKELDNEIREAGEKAIYEVGVGKMHPELIKLVGRLKFRTSYGQNALNHSMEVANLAGLLASELGENVNLAKRAGLLHDIGKAIDFEMEGSHVKIGVDLAKKYGEDPIVINAIASHHGDTAPTSVIASIVAIADAISASRPGARNDSSENYIQRLEQLEDIGNKIDGVEKAYAVQAGRELRVMVKPEEVDDLTAHQIARNKRENRK